MRVRDVMTRELVTISPATPCDEARRLMDAHGVRHLLVVNADHLVGIVSDHDVGATSADDRCVARRVMTAHPLTVTSGMRVEHAARLMLEARICSLAVVDDDRLVGIVTHTDVLHALVRVIDTATEERIAVDFARLR